MDALLAGACGYYVLKDQPIDQIVESVRAAARGESLMSPRIASRLTRRVCEPNDTQSPGSDPHLTSRELEVLQLVSRGIDNPEIAKTLFLSEHTVISHVSTYCSSFRSRIASRLPQRGARPARVTGSGRPARVTGSWSLGSWDQLQKLRLGIDACPQPVDHRLERG